MPKKSDIKKELFLKTDKNPPLDFIVLTAHQLKKPLSSMKLSLQMLLGGDFGQMSEEQKEIIEKVSQSNETSICLVKDLLDTAKVGDKKSLYDLTPVDIGDLIESVVAFEQDEMKDKKINFRFQKPKTEIPKILLDKEKMYLAFQNILDNAIKYTPAGGNININLDVRPTHIELKFQDSGIGIPKDQKAKLFTKFFRGINAIKIEAAGSGLGLFITKNIIDGHHGKIWFESKENKGTTFFVSLPLAVE